MLTHVTIQAGRTHIRAQYMTRERKTFDWFWTSCLAGVVVMAYAVTLIV